MPYRSNSSYLSVAQLPPNNRRKSAWTAEFRYAYQVRVGHTVRNNVELRVGRWYFVFYVNLRYPPSCFEIEFHARCLSEQIEGITGEKPGHSQLIKLLDYFFYIYPISFPETSYHPKGVLKGATCFAPLTVLSGVERHPVPVRQIFFQKRRFKLPVSWIRPQTQRGSYSCAIRQKYLSQPPTLFVALQI